MLPLTFLFVIAVLFSAAFAFRIFQIIIRRTEKRRIIDSAQLLYAVAGYNIFSNAKELAKKFPHSRATTLLLEKVAPGWYVQISTKHERFWVKIYQREGDKITGIVDNNLVDTDSHGLEYGDTIEFSIDNVFEVQKPNAVEINPTHLQNIQKKNSNN